MAFRGAKAPTPNNDNGTVVPNRKANDQLRTRKYLTRDEVKLIADVAKKGRSGQRDWLMVTMCYRHGLRVGELCDMKWADINLKAGTLFVRRLKDSRSGEHFLEADEIRALGKLKKQGKSDMYVFISERGTPISTAGFRKAFARWGVKAKMPFPTHPHQLRHGCGYELARRLPTRALQQYLGHVSIMHTVAYSDMSNHEFRGLWS